MASTIRLEHGGVAVLVATARAHTAKILRKYKGGRADMNVRDLEFRLLGGSLCVRERENGQ